jgi:hypothetical protein
MELSEDRRRRLTACLSELILRQIEPDSQGGDRNEQPPDPSG